MTVVHMAARVQLKQAFGLGGLPRQISLPTFLFPAVRNRSPLGRRMFLGSDHKRRRVSDSALTSRSPSEATADATAPGLTTLLGGTAGERQPAPGQGSHDAEQARQVNRLPDQCWGCGAMSQTIDPGLAGFFDLKRKAVSAFLEPGRQKKKKPPREEDQVLERVLQNLDLDALAKTGVSLANLVPALPHERRRQAPPKATTVAPLCDRCHDLVHNQVGQPIYHPSVEALRETIQQSPFKYNHVYHVVDAADFPMSLIPGLTRILDSVALRSKNRRSKSTRFHSGQSTKISFVISRADLLAPVKESVDALVPKLKEILRDALGRTAKNARLGNVWCVSAKRGWWTKELKEDVWRTGGAGWMVGKVNVGKSRLFEAIFPKGRMGSGKATSASKISTVQAHARQSLPVKAATGLATEQSASDVPGAQPAEPSEHNAFGDLGGNELLPPARPETEFPEMPIVSALPGTTASPIRVPYGNGRGELIDLPGLERSDLDSFVEVERRSSLIMKSRLVPAQQNLRPGQSLLLGGGLIRITPRTPDLVFLAYNFTPLEPHLTSTDKAIALQTKSADAPSVPSIATAAAAESIQSAGVFQLHFDVTRARTGPITRKDAVGVKLDLLPYRVVAVDLLIEGCGWVEIVAQVRTKDLFESPAASTTPGLDPADTESFFAGETPPPNSDAQPNWPTVEVFSPEGRFVGARPPINGWLMNKPRETAKSNRSRPRPSMRGAKKGSKIAGRRAHSA